ncbi:MAG TPA: hypothetical protein VE028_08110 [Nitratidesulfovibrio sp.]|nr:hypothetical protein [Nitratidesulfovibrio sp.]
MDVDPIGRIYSHAAALRTIAARLPEEHGGLALILALLGEDLQHCGEALDDTPCAAASAPARGGTGAGPGDGPPWACGRPS